MKFVMLILLSLMTLNATKATKTEPVHTGSLWVITTVQQTVHVDSNEQKVAETQPTVYYEYVAEPATEPSTVYIEPVETEPEPVVIVDIPPVTGVNTEPAVVTVVGADGGDICLN